MTEGAVTLREIDDENREAVIGLRVGPGQDRFVASVAESLEEAAETPQGGPGTERSTPLTSRSAS
ncbi:MAG: hypothetical protein ACR2LP_05360 [Candidatus Limnocylindrales bacterium]